MLAGLSDDWVGQAE